jgi:hypothetical protein
MKLQNYNLEITGDIRKAYQNSLRNSPLIRDQKAVTVIQFDLIAVVGMDIGIKFCTVAICDTGRDWHSKMRVFRDTYDLDAI